MHAVQMAGVGLSTSWSANAAGPCWSSSMLMALSGHRNLRTLCIYVQPSTEAVAAALAEHDPAADRPLGAAAMTSPIEAFLTRHAASRTRTVDDHMLGTALPPERGRHDLSLIELD
ncbi:hypothetical protein [Streptosporangium roseum]|uniref:hypothetical protein n=1 Tax=Streptosporangium roseum TaxID=2001 RepID=UPI0033278C74